MINLPREKSLDLISIKRGYEQDIFNDSKPWSIRENDSFISLLNSNVRGAKEPSSASLQEAVTGKHASFKSFNSTLEGQKEQVSPDVRESAPKDQESVV